MVPGAEATPSAPPVDLGAAWETSQVQVSPDLATLPLGESRQFALKLGDAGDARAAVQWSTLDSSTAVVNQAGVVTALSGGTAHIVGRIGPAADTATVVVSVAVASITISPRSGEITAGQQSTLTAAVLDGLQHPMSGVSVVWTSLDPAIATISSAGVVTGVATGDARIVASAGGKSDTVTVRVSAVAVAAVAVTPGALSLSVGGSGQLTATATAASGTVLSDRLTTWTSSDESIAKVSPSGQVSAVSAGTATITATVDGKRASAQVTATPAGVASVAVSANATSLTVGQTARVTATARDANGAELTGRTVSWTSSDAQVATVSSAGLVSAVGAGSVTITGTIEGKSATVTITVTRQTVASVVVSVNSASLAVGQAGQASAAALDAGGQPVSGRTITWSIAPSAVASVSGSGLVTGIAAGTATLTATVDGVSGTTTMTIVAAPTQTPTTPVASNSIAPTLPRATVDVRGATVTGASIRVAAGQDLQAAIDAARPGDELVLDAGATYTGNFVLRPKTGDAWVTIRSSATAPAAGTRVTPATASGFARIVTPNYGPAIATEPGAHHFRFVGVEITAVSGITHVNALVAFGDGSVAQTQLAQVPHHLILDRVYVHGNSTLDLRRCVAFNSAWSAVADSYLTDCHSNEGDAQAIYGSNGPGPFTIVNNTLEASGENIMFGGDDPRNADMVSADITIRGNHIRKPLAWQGVWVSKNLLELKIGKRVLIENNVMENSWVSAQQGFAFVLWSVNQGGGATWSETSDVTVQYNVIRNTANGFQLNAKYFATQSPPMSRVAIRHNRLTAVGTTGAMGPGGRMFQVDGPIPDLSITHNTTEGASHWLYFVAQPITPLPRMTVLDNIAFVAGMAVRSDYDNGANAWTTYAAGSGGVMRGNVLAAAIGGLPEGNTAPVGTATDATAAMGFVNALGGDYRLSSASAYKAKATDGSDPGADGDALTARTSGVVR